MTFSGPGPRAIRRNASGRWVWGFFKEAAGYDKKQVEPVRVGVGYFTGLLQDF